MKTGRISKILIEGVSKDSEIGEVQGTSGEDGTKNGQPESSASKETSKSRSIYDDTLSENRSRSRWNTIGLVIGAVIVGGGLAGVFLTDVSEEEKAKIAQVIPREKEPSELALLVDDVRNRTTEESDQTDSQTDPEGSQPDGDSTAATTSPSIAAAEETDSSQAARQPRPPSAASTQQISPSLRAEATAPSRPKPAPRSPSELQEVRPEEESAPQPVVEETIAENTVEADENPGQDEPVMEQGPDPAHEEAFKSLVQNSEAASKLVAGAYDTLEYLQWRVVQSNESEVWVDLIAKWKNAGDDDVHFIWSVNVETGRVRALSDPARNLGR